MKTFPQKVTIYPQLVNISQKITIHPQLVNISPKKITFTLKYVDLRALSSIVASRIYALFDVKSTSVPNKIGIDLTCVNV